MITILSLLLSIFLLYRNYNKSIEMYNLITKIERVNEKHTVRYLSLLKRKNYWMNAWIEEIINKLQLEEKLMKETKKHVQGQNSKGKEKQRTRLKVVRKKSREKVCFMCKKSKSIDDFNKDSTKKDGLYPVCRDCRGIKKRERHFYISNGYIYYGNERYHRYLMEKYLGRKLQSNEHVHHINGNKLDNRIENLEVLNESEHHKKHPSQRTVGYYNSCLSCGKQIYTVPSQDIQFCSYACYGKVKKGTHLIKLKHEKNITNK